MSDPQPRKVVPTGEQVSIHGVIFDMQQLEPISDSLPPPIAGKQREKMGASSKMKVPSIRTIVDSSEGPLGEKTMSKQSEESGLALGDSDKEKQKDE
ncbi:hypothetical protein ABVK25_010724 [Lepraria finkii]|uniref:Uncharacterized protein n=1 Tax=Lepraria finkii TaxID=1340010 RepID=A0ABR4AVX1_9LECA